MGYVSIVKVIRGHYANIKFWFICWKKDKASGTVEQIKASLAKLKELMGMVSVSMVDDGERIAIANMAKEVKEIEEDLDAK